MDCSMPGSSTLHYLPEFAQTHVHWIGDSVQSSHPLSFPSPLAFNLSQHQGIFQWVSSWNQVAQVLEFSYSTSPSNEYSGFISFRIDWLDSLQPKGLSRVSPNTTDRNGCQASAVSFWTQVHTVPGEVSSQCLSKVVIQAIFTFSDELRRAAAFALEFPSGWRGLGQICIVVWQSSAQPYFRSFSFLGVMPQGNFCTSDFISGSASPWGTHLQPALWLWLRKGLFLYELNSSTMYVHYIFVGITDRIIVWLAYNFFLDLNLDLPNCWESLSLGSEKLAENIRISIFFFALQQTCPPSLIAVVQCVFIWLLQVLGAACRIFDLCCSVRDL